MLKKFWARFFAPKPVQINVSEIGALVHTDMNECFALTPKGREVVRKIGKNPAAKKKAAKKALPRKPATKKKTARKAK